MKQKKELEPEIIAELVRYETQSANEAGKDAEPVVPSEKFRAKMKRLLEGIKK